MVKIKVAIFDEDKGYVERFADYLLSYKSAEMDLAVFTGVQFFYDALDVDKFHLLVLGSGYEAVVAQVKSLRIPILVLTEYSGSLVRESVGMQDEQIVYTPKYQSMDVITRQMQLMTEKGLPQAEVRRLYGEPEVIGVISPVRHELQMLFSLLYAKNAGQNGKVLYVNLLEFSGFSELFGDREYDIGDAVLQLREEKMNVKQLLSCIYEEDGFAAIYPVTNPENVKEITADDIQRLLQAISQYTDYQTVVLDIGLNLNGFVEVLVCCSKIYCMRKKGYLFETQMRQFFAYLEKAVDEVFLERIRQIDVPGQTKVICGGVNLLEQLDWGDFGDYVRSVM